MLDPILAVSDHAVYVGAHLLVATHWLVIHLVFIKKNFLPQHRFHAPLRNPRHQWIYLTVILILWMQGSGSLPLTVLTFTEPSKFLEEEKSITSPKADPILPSASQAQGTEKKLITPTDRIQIISKRLATTIRTKRLVSIIDPPLVDPTIRKKHRSEHPMNRMLARRLE